MSHLPPDPPLEPQAPPRVEPKAPSESVLAAPRAPVTRWNRRYLLAGAAGLAGLVGLGFYVGFGGAHRPQTRPVDEQANVDTNTPQTPAIAGRYAAGYGDPTVQAGPGQPGFARLPPPALAPGAVDPAGAGAVATAPPPPPPVDPRVQAAQEQAIAARASGPFFGGAPPTPSAAPGVTLAAAPAGPTAAAAPGEVQPGNGQAAKVQFAQGSRAEDYLLNPLRPAASPWEVKAGTIIPAALVTALNSDLPGEVIAQVTEPVYDHRTGRTVLIPQGSRLIGQYDSQIAYGQNRLMVAWNRIIMPDGRSINIGSMTGADLTGAAGLQDRRDGHFGQLARGILLSTLFSVGAAAAQDAGTRSSGGLVINSAGSGVANSAQMAGQQITGRDLNRQPTLMVRAGWPLRVIVSKDMILAPYP
ncbi:MAG: conjugal transfer protein TrbI [Phenylobacterium sp.]|uniref:TrbI/VirB10 family protein n=1 Tax=Phenylobacterium sp. TaxID=1871053 RepID=UPI0025CD4537|nr:TrbI/VirB10 family protein [Phenylobacterium sp.]MBT9470759.1 conjugal transfer protein TrbI [Phenylobacterium sp.]